MDQNFQGNSKSKTDDLPVEKKELPETGEEKLSPFMTAFTMIFSDTPSKIFKNFIRYRLAPCFSDFLHQIGTNFLDEAFDGGGNSRPREEYRDNRVKRSGNYDKYQKKLASNKDSKTKRQMNYKDLRWRTRKEAENVLGELMDDLLRQPSGVSIARLFELYSEDLVEEEDYPYTYNDWGWTDLKDVDVKMSGSNDFYIDFPRPEPL